MAEINLLENVQEWSSVENPEGLQEQHPYIHVEPLPESKEGYQASFSIKLHSIVDRSFLENNRLDHGLDEQVNFIRCLLAPDSGRTAELRYLAFPNPGHWLGGKLDVILICKSTSNAFDTALQDAKIFWEEVRPNLNMLAGSFEFAPVRSSEKFMSFHEPFEIADIAEITRREVAVPLSHGEFFYIACPFINSGGNMGRLCRGLLLQRHPVLYSTAIQPTHLLPHEKAYLNNPAVKVHSMDCSGIGFVTGNGCENGVGLPMKEEGLKDVYLQKITIAGSHQLSSFLLDLVGSEITRPSLPLEVNKSPLHQSYSGGYLWRKAEGTCERRAAFRNLRYHETNNWGRSFAPAGLKRLRDLFDPVQAGFAFRLPVMTHGEPIPGIMSRRSIPFMPPQTAAEGVVIGASRYGGTQNEVKLAVSDRRLHSYIQGATGTGKTTLILNMAVQDIRAGHGVIVIDWHGDLSSELIKRIPKDRADDLIYFNPSDTEYPVGLNLLTYDPRSPRKDQQKERIIDFILSYFQRQYQKEHMGPVFFQNIRNGLHLIMADEENVATLLDFPMIFLDEKFMKRKLQAVKSPLIRKFWEETYSPKRYRASSEGINLLEYIICKFSPFVDMACTRNIFGQAVSKLNFREALDERKILICNFSKGLLGESFSQLLAFMTLFKIEEAALSRADLPEEERADSFLYLDECQNLQTEHFHQLLSEMRKYRVNITLANQHFSQLDEKMRDAILANCGTLVVFKTGVKDAGILEPAFYPFNKKLIVGQPRFHAVVKTLVGVESSTLTMETLPEIQVEEGHATAEEVMQLSRRKYGRRREEVEKEIFEGLGWSKAEEEKKPECNA